jgi:hypothetical protein
MNEIQSLMEQLHDIEGLDAIGKWPLAAGWWMMIALGLLMLSVAVWCIFRRLAFIYSWRYDTIQKLSKLEQSLDGATSGEAVIIFSEYMRRIAMRRFARSECAGLVGDEWLEWLSCHDEKKFDWKEKGKILLQAPYASDHRVSTEQLKILIHAAKDWVQ